MGLTESGGTSTEEVLAAGIRQPSWLDKSKYGCTSGLSAMSKERLW